MVENVAKMGEIQKQWKGEENKFGIFFGVIVFGCDLLLGNWSLESIVFFLLNTGMLKSVSRLGWWYNKLQFLPFDPFQPNVNDSQEIVVWRWILSTIILDLGCWSLSVSALPTEFCLPLFPNSCFALGGLRRSLSSIASFHIFNSSRAR